MKYFDIERVIGGKVVKSEIFLSKKKNNNNNNNNNSAKLSDCKIY